jgi:hypothetical protein
MSGKYRFSMAQRTAIWLAWDKRCAYTREAIAFRDLEIDHVVPESMLDGDVEFSQLRQRLSLPGDFKINSFHNWVPTLHSANSAKASRPFADSSVLYFLELAAAKLNAVTGHYERLRQEQRSERHLTQIARLVEEGVLTLEEVVDFIRLNAPPGPHQSGGPLVITVGVGPETFTEAVFYGPTCDSLEKHLMDELRENLSGFVEQTEPSERSGESLSVRFAVWHSPLESVLAAIDRRWELLEVASFTDVYPTANPEDFYAQAVASRHRQHVQDSSDRIFGVRRCPDCGGTSLRRRNAEAQESDRKVFTIDCSDCGWGDWSE